MATQEAREKTLRVFKQVLTTLETLPGDASGCIDNLTKLIDDFDKLKVEYPELSALSKPDTEVYEETYTAAEMQVINSLTEDDRRDLIMRAFELSDNADAGRKCNISEKMKLRLGEDRRFTHYQLVFVHFMTVAMRELLGQRLEQGHNKGGGSPSPSLAAVGTGDMTSPQGSGISQQGNSSTLPFHTKRY